MGLAPVMKLAATTSAISTQGEALESQDPLPRASARGYPSPPRHWRVGASGSCLLPVGGNGGNGRRLEAWRPGGGGFHGGLVPGLSRASTGAANTSAGAPGLSLLGGSWRCGEPGGSGRGHAQGSGRRASLRGIRSEAGARGNTAAAAARLCLLPDQGPRVFHAQAGAALRRRAGDHRWQDNHPGAVRQQGRGSSPGCGEP